MSSFVSTGKCLIEIAVFLVIIALSTATATSAATTGTKTPSTMQTLLQKVRELPPTKQRAVAAVVGSAVADAATRPFHWVYDRKTLEETVGSKDPEFWPTSVSPYYTLPTGRRSCYNEAGYLMLKSLDVGNNGALQGGFSAEAFVHTVCEFFSPESDYAASLRMRKEMYTPAKRYDKREPVPGPWQHGAITHLLGTVNDGKEVEGENLEMESMETDGLCAAIPLISRLASDDTCDEATMTDLVSKATTLLCANTDSMKRTQAAARLLKHCILRGDELRSSSASQSTFAESIQGPLIEIITTQTDGSVDDVILGDVDEVVAAMECKIACTDAIEKFGKACANPGSFKGSVLAILDSLQGSSSSSAGLGRGFSYGVRRTILGGGCNCSRANLVGACLGAIYGFDYESEGSGSRDGIPMGIPMDWLMKTDKAEEILSMAIDKVASC